MQDLIKLIEQEKERVSKSLKITQVLCVVLVALVSAEVILIRNVVRSHLAPDKVAFMLTQAVYEQIPVLNDRLLTGTYQTAPVVANQMVEYSLQILRGVNPVAKEKILLLTDTLLVEVRAKGGPIFQNVILEVCDGISANKKQLQDEVVVKKMVDELLNQWEVELQNRIDDSLKGSLVKMNDEVKTLLSTPDAKMTKKQAAQKKMLICSRILIDRLSEKK